MLFFHGREAYRRNSLLILYTFYKNFLYVIVQFYFGFYSTFSGQALYEQQIYQLYNITMTSLPIMWYAIYDFEYEKDLPKDEYVVTERRLIHEEDVNYFMKNPLLYRIGMRCDCFSNVLFFKWVLYALWHALVILYSVLYALNQYKASAPDGKEIGFWVAGMAIYGVCIIVANVLLAAKFHIHNWVGVVFFAMMITAYFLFYWLMSLFYTNELNHLF